MSARDHYEHLYRAKRTAGAPGWQGPDADREIARHLDVLLAAAGIPPGRCLEVGCGAGNLTRHLVERGWTVVGIDVAPTAIAWARERFAPAGAGAVFHVACATDLTRWPDRSFDLVVDSLCLHGILGADRHRFLSEARRVLRPGGKLFVVTMCDDPNSEDLARRFDGPTRFITNDRLPTHYLGRAPDILAEVSAVGLSIRYAARREAEPQSPDQHLLLAVGERDPV